MHAPADMRPLIDSKGAGRRVMPGVVLLFVEAQAMKGISISACVLMLILSGQNVCACSCVPVTASEIESLSDDEFIRRFVAIDGAVFTSRVVERGSAKTELGWMRRFTFEVEDYWKGPVAKRIDIHTASHGAACGVSYAVGRKYLVLAANQGGALHTNLCAHLGATKNREVLLRRLGKGEMLKGRGV